MVAKVEIKHYDIRRATFTLEELHELYKKMPKEMQSNVDLLLTDLEVQGITPEDKDMELTINDFDGHVENEYGEIEETFMWDGEGLIDWFEKEV